jgi:hypothetical protein
MTASPNLADELIRNTIRLALLLYVVALTATLRGKPMRWLWTLALFVYLLHVAAAFHFAHGWSHAAAVEHTRQISGVGEGIFVNHLFTLLWTADVFWWWLWPDKYAGRSVWFDRGLHSFMLFVIFNATVVFETGATRWVGLALLGWLLAVAVYGRLTRQSSAAP